MKNKNGVIRVIQLWDGNEWQHSCLLYKSEMVDFFRRLTCFKGVIKARWRLSGSDRWHKVFSSDF